MHKIKIIYGLLLIKKMIIFNIYIMDILDYISILIIYNNYLIKKIK
jgi:hypothetical protein